VSPPRIISGSAALLEHGVGRGVDDAVELRADLVDARERAPQRGVSPKTPATSMIRPPCAGLVVELDDALVASSSAMPRS
jgi:hypothetical protein